MSCRAAVIILICALVTGSKTTAASLTPIVSTEGMSIVLKGDIELHDPEALETLMETLGKNGPSPQQLLLDSQGGNLLGGIGLARFIHRRGDLATRVTYGSTCASACFLVFASGREKFADYNSYIGVHGVTDSEGRVSNRTIAATLAMANVSRELGVPATINEKITTTPPNEIVWLTIEDLKSMGVTMIGRPVQSARGVSSEFILRKRNPALDGGSFAEGQDRATQSGKR